jgi:hypothetical protein
MSEPSCDVCEQPIEGDIFKACLPRPSDPIWVCSIMWACAKCAPQIGAKTDDYWEEDCEQRGLLYEG